MKTYLMRIKVLLLFLFTPLAFVFASKADTLVVVSKSMNKEIRNIVITPDSYTSQREPYPVVYMLHGATDDYRFWPEYIPEVNEFVDRYNLILVFPDGAKTSWYFDSPLDKEFQYETYISKELIDAVDKKYNTIKDKSGRAITGLSMGGHGAFYLAFKHPDIWGAAGSTSGGLDIRPFPDKWEIAKRLGSYSQYPDNWERNTVINMIHLLEGQDLELIFDCGVDDFFYKGNKEAHEKMLKESIPHTYIERPGGHTLDYWVNSIEYHLLFFDDYFKLSQDRGDDE